MGGRPVRRLPMRANYAKGKGDVMTIADILSDAYADIRDYADNGAGYDVRILLAVLEALRIEQDSREMGR